MLDLENLQTDKDYEKYLLQLTGYHYVFAEASTRCAWDNNENYEDGLFYQLMPYSNDDGLFDSYCAERENNQFFKKRASCVLHFVFYWSKWATRPI